MPFVTVGIGRPQAGCSVAVASTPGLWSCWAEELTVFDLGVRAWGLGFRT